MIPTQQYRIELIEIFYLFNLFFFLFVDFLQDSVWQRESSGLKENHFRTDYDVQKIFLRRRLFLEHITVALYRIENIKVIRFRLSNVNEFRNDDACAIYFHFNHVSIEIWCEHLCILHAHKCELNGKSGIKIE